MNSRSFIVVCLDYNPRDSLFVDSEVEFPVLGQLDDLVVYDAAQQLQTLDVEVLLLQALLLVHLRVGARDAAEKDKEGFSRRATDCMGI